MRHPAAIWLAIFCGGLCARSAWGEAHWAFQSVRTPAVPHVVEESWPQSEIDRFILARLEAAELKPGHRATDETLLRRLTFDLAGRPPTIAEQDAWLASPGPDGLRAVVQRLLASPEFGERWAQHWLDVARFAESSGGGRSLMFPQAWRYRDYVIRALNDDMPFDQFIVEQLAGDQLPFDSDRQRDRQTIATGFLTLGAINYEAQDKQKLEMDIVDEQVDTIGRAFLGLSLGCARCHDHKFDPIETEEYYGLAGIFTSTRSVVHENVGRPMTRELTSGEEVDRYQQYRAQLARLEQKLESLNKQDAAKKKVEALRRKIKKLKAQAPQKPVAMAVDDAAEPADTPIRIAGDVHLHGRLAPRSFVAAAGLPDSMVNDQGLPTISSGTSGRLELARWIASEENRLTSRVIVNRIWHHLFGRGLVPTPDDFGVTGQPPTHPDLLDFLASTFVEENWSIKQLVRRIVMSETYALASEADSELLDADPNNKLLGRARRRQLDAEAIRNAMLEVGGQTDPDRGGPTIARLAKYDTGYEFTSRRRSIYVPRFRNTQPDVVAAFGGANASMVTGSRSPSILPTQALYLLNGESVIEAADQTANNLLESPADDDARLQQLYRRTLGRRPTPAETKLVTGYLQQLRTREVDDAEQQAWSGVVQMLFCSLDFRYLN